MITANDVMKKSFEQAKLGYKMEDVDDFLGEIADTLKSYEAELTTLRADKEESAKKIEVLVASIKQYRADEEAIKEAMVDARRQKQNIIAEAQEKAAEILSSANLKADELKASINVNIDAEKAELERVQNEVKDFKKELLEMYREHISLISNLPGEIEEDDEEEYEEDLPDDMESTKYFETKAIKEADAEV